MKVILTWHYQTKRGVHTSFTSEYLTVKDAILLYEDIQQTGRAVQLEIIDEFDGEWTLKQLKKYMKELETEPSNITLYFDGGYKEQTKEAGIGIVIYYEQNKNRYRIRENYWFPQLHSNNEAEYAALHFGIQQLQQLGVNGQEIQIIGDAQVVIQQMNGEWPVYEARFAAWADKIEQLFQQQKLRPLYKFVSRNENSEAHKLATQALQHTKISANKRLSS